MSDENTPKDEQSAERDRELVNDARRQVEEARQRADETATSPQDTRIEISRAGFVVPDRVGSVRLVREIGRGGMGVVHLGRDELLERNVAVKFLLNAVSGPDDPDFAQFLKGARAAAAVKHPGLTVIYHADLVENVPYLVLEYIDGPTLRQVSKQTGPLSTAATLAVMDAVSTAIGELHEQGIIHRDIKPSNVLLDRDGRVFVTDFGLACARPPGTAGSTITGVAGTLAYMAPEMFEGVVSARSDVYALGIMAYELLTGELPFTGNADELRSRHRQDPLPLDALREREVEPALIEVIERATHKDMMFRHKSARHLLEALNRAVPEPACWAEGRKALPQLVSRVQPDSAAAERTETGSSSSQDYYETLRAQAARKRRVRPRVDDRASAEGKSHTGPAAQTSLEDLLCFRCGYNLRGLAPPGCCPECGSPVTRSMQGDLLSAADPKWLARVLRGQLYIVVGCALYLSNILMAIAFEILMVIAFEMASSYGFPDAYLNLSGFKAMVSRILFPVSLALVLVGVVGVTSLDPRLSLTEQQIGLRRIARGAAITALVIMLLQNAVRFGDFGGAAVAAILSSVLRWTFRVVLSLVVVALTYYLARLAERIPDPRLTQRARSAAKRFALFAALCIVASAIASYDTRPFWAGGALHWTYLRAFGSLFGLVAFAYGVAVVSVWWTFRGALKGCLIEARHRAAGKSAGEQA